MTGMHALPDLDLPSAAPRVWPLGGRHTQAVSGDLAEPAPQSIVRDEERQHRLTALLRVVEAEIVPRLVSSLTGRGTPSALPGSRAMPIPAMPVLGHDTILAFAGTLLRGEAGPAAATIAALFADGVTAETICIELMAGAAVHLGEMWAEDVCTFTDVTIATSVMQFLLRDVTARLSPAVLATPVTGSAVLVQTPGEQHSFGVAMLAEFFRAAGWETQTPRVVAPKDMARLTAERPVDLVGFSLGAEVHLGKLRRCIGSARRSSRNPSLLVMVGGPLFVAQPDLASAVGADGTAPDAAAAVLLAGELLGCIRGDVANPNAVR